MKAKDAVVISEQVLKVILRDVPSELRDRLISENTQPLDVIVAKAFDDGVADLDATYMTGNEYVNKIEI